MKAIAIIGPMSTSGEPGPNLNQAAVAAAELLESGFAPFVPHVTWILHAIAPHVHVEQWKRWDRFWIRKCDAVLRLPGESEGADAEEALAHQIRIPVYYSVRAAVEARRKL